MNIIICYLSNLLDRNVSIKPSNASPPDIVTPNQNK